RPGGTVKGLWTPQADTATKRIELFREMVPGLHRLAILANVSNPAVVLEIAEAQAAARMRGLEVVTPEIRRGEDIVPAFEALKGRADALYVCGDPLVFTNRVRVNTLAQGARLPTIYLLGEYVEAGGLMSYDQASPICTGALPIMSTRFCAGRNRPISRSSSPPNST